MDYSSHRRSADGKVQYVPGRGRDKLHKYGEVTIFSFRPQGEISAPSSFRELYRHIGTISLILLYLPPRDVRRRGAPFPQIVDSHCQLLS